MAKGRETYIIFDIEADGPCPGIGMYSMLSLGACAVDHDLQPLPSTFYANVKPLASAKEDKATMEWWAKHPEAYAKTQESPLDAHTVMRRFVAWAKKLPDKKILAAFPSGFDFTFLYWYLCYCVGKDNQPFSFSCIDMKTLGMAILGSTYSKSAKRHYPKAWFGPGKHTHDALEDALDQRDLFISMMQAMRCE